MGSKSAKISDYQQSWGYEDGPGKGPVPPLLMAAISINYRNPDTYNYRRNATMKQKYLIINDKKNKQFKIQEFAELNKQKLSLLCEEAYDYKTIKSAVSAGKDALIATLRTNNFYPPGIYAEKIAHALVQLQKAKDEESVELFFDDINLLAGKRHSSEISEPLEDDSADLDEMLEDDFDENYPEKNGLKKIDSSLKIVDEDYVDANDDE